MVDLKAGVVRILDQNSATVGTGFLVTDEGLIATCGHVVEAAGTGPGGAVRLVLHATGEEREALVEPAWWRASDAEDVAILRLDEPLPEGVTSLPLGSSAGSEGHALTTFGFPDPKPIEGMAGKCEVVGRTTERGFPVLQLRSSEVTPGFSGAPVLDTVTRRVVGMVTAITVPDRYGRLAETAFITPTETLRAICPELQLSNLCPYRGLAAFTERDAEFFFGRERLVADLVAHLRGNPRFLAVVGPSGSGKSSVVQAGLFPALRRGEVPGSADWHLLSFRPGADPFAALTTAGLDVPQKGDWPVALRAFLETHPKVKRLVLFADQFEELFTLCPQPIQEQFLRQLAALLEGNQSVTVVLTLRADFYGHLLRHRPLVDWLKIGQVNVPPMGLEELRAAVEEPALRLGLRFEPGLVETIVEEADAADHPLPLLESALTQLWAKREDGTLTHAAYQGVGRVAGAIGQWAEDAYTELAPEERPLARRVFTRLVRYGEREVADTRQRQSLSELVTRPEEWEPLHRLVRRLADARLLVTGGDPGAEMVEIIHDALLQQWGRLKHWTTEQREFYLWRQRLDERLQEWEEKEQDEGALLRGALLAEAERWLGERPDDLNLTERVYIRESATLREREEAARERLRWRIILGLVGGLLVALVLAVVAGLGWQSSAERESARATAQADAEVAVTVEAAARQTAEAAVVAEAAARQTAEAAAIAEAEARQIAVARQLAAQAQTMLDNTGTGLVRSVLLAIESLRRSHTLEGNQTLRLGLVLLPRPVARIVHRNDVDAVAFSPDGRWLATGSNDVFGPCEALVWEAATGREVARMQHEDWVQVVAFSPDGRWLATGSGFAGDPGEARVWEVATGKEVARMAHENSVFAIAFSPDGRWVATGSGDVIGPGEAGVWEAATGREVARMQYEDWVMSVAFSPDGRWLATGSGDADRSGEACVWEAATGQEVARLAHEDMVWTVAFSPDGKWLATGSLDGTAHVWEVATEQELARMAHGDWVQAVAFSPNGRWLAMGSGTQSWAGISGEARVWEVATEQVVARMAHEGPVDTVTFSPNGEWLATGSWDATARVWEVATGQEVARMTHEYSVNVVTFSSDGHWLATGSGCTGCPGEARVWEVTSGQEVAWTAHHGSVSKLTFSPDGKWLATASWDGTPRVWEMATGREVACEIRGWEPLPGQEGVGVRTGKAVGAWSWAFSPDGRWLATGGTDGTARVWEVGTGQEVAQMVHEAGDAGRIEGVAFSPDGQWLATGSRDGRARVWEAVTGQEVARMQHEDSLKTVAFSPDGRWVVSADEGGTVRAWLWRPEDLIAEACARLTRNLTLNEWQQYIGNEPYRKTCPKLPEPEGWEAISQPTPSLTPTSTPIPTASPIPTYTPLATLTSITQPFVSPLESPLGFDSPLPAPSGPFVSPLPTPRPEGTTYDCWGGAVVLLCLGILFAVLGPKILRARAKHRR